MNILKLDYKNLIVSLFISISLPSIILYLIFNMPSGYKLNLYSSYPILFWIFVIIFYIFILFYIYFNKNKKYIISIILIIFYLSFFIITNNYVLAERTDDFSHLGEVNNIGSKGQISNENFYPISHILLSNIKSIANLDAIQLSNIIYPLLSLIFIFNFYLITFFYIGKTNITYKKNLSIIIPIFFIFFLGDYHFNMRPHLISFLFFGISLFSLLKYIEKTENRYFIIFLLTAVIIPLTHPLFGFTFIGSVIIILVVKYMIIERNLKKFKSYWILMIASILPGFTWFFYNLASYEKISFIISRVLSNNTNSVASRTINLLKIGDFNLFELFGRGIFLYMGRYFFLIILIIPYLLNRIHSWKKTGKLSFSNIMIKELFIIIILYTFWQLFFVFGQLTIHNPQRLININILIYILIPFLVIITLKLLMINRKKTITIIFIVLFFAQISSIFIIFPSPMVFQPDNSLTSNEIFGMNWFENNKNSLNITEFRGQLVTRYYDYKFGFDVSEEKQKIIENQSHIIKIGLDSSLNRLFYDKYSIFPLKGFYIVLTKFSTIPYFEMDKWKQTGRLYESDLNRFNNDFSVCRVYSSLDIGIYKT